MEFLEIWIEISIPEDDDGKQERNLEVRPKGHNKVAAAAIDTGQFLRRLQQLQLIQVSGGQGANPCFLS